MLRDKYGISNTISVKKNESNQVKIIKEEGANDRLRASEIVTKLNFPIR